MRLRSGSSSPRTFLWVPDSLAIRPSRSPSARTTRPPAPPPPAGSSAVPAGSPAQVADRVSAPPRGSAHRRGGGELAHLVLQLEHPCLVHLGSRDTQPVRQQSVPGVGEHRFREELHAVHRKLPVA